MLASFFSFRPIRLLVPSQRKNTAKTSASPTSSEKENEENKEQLTSYNMITSKVLPFWRLPTYGCRQIMTSVVDQKSAAYNQNTSGKKGN